MNKAGEHNESSTILNEMEAILEGKVPITAKKPRKKKVHQDPGLLLVNLLRSNKSRSKIQKEKEKTFETRFKI